MLALALAGCTGHWAYIDNAPATTTDNTARDTAQAAGQTGAPAASAQGDANKVPGWVVDQSAPNEVLYYGCEVVAGIQPTYAVGQCIWRTANPNEAVPVWVPSAYIANGGTDGKEEYSTSFGADWLTTQPGSALPLPWAFAAGVSAPVPPAA
jgi:hypothetical protein